MHIFSLPQLNTLFMEVKVVSVLEFTSCKKCFFTGSSKKIGRVLKAHNSKRNWENTVILFSNNLAHVQDFKCNWYATVAVNVEQQRCKVKMSSFGFPSVKWRPFRTKFNGRCGQQSINLLKQFRKITVVFFANDHRALIT